MTKINKYTLNEIQTILFNGFDFVVPEETLEIISQIALQVGSVDYVKTPVFKKNENIIKKNKRTKNMDGDNWKTTQDFQTTKIKERDGINLTIDTIRSILYKLSDKNYLDMCNKIHEIIDKLDNNISSEDLSLLSSNIFDIVSTNNFYPKLYADLFCDLINKYAFINKELEQNFKNFINLFDNIEYVDPDVDYNKFCDINKINEKRKLLSAFYFNLMLNDIIPKHKIVNITRNLLFQVYSFISVENKKNEVDELTETISILYKKEAILIYECEEYQKIEGHTISELIKKISDFKVKDYKSLTNKALFKFMDLVEMVEK